MAKHEYNGNEDAERILTNVLKRERFGYEVRNALAEALQRVVARELEAERDARLSVLRKAAEERARNVKAS